MKTACGIKSKLYIHHTEEPLLPIEDIILVMLYIFPCKISCVIWRTFLFRVLHSTVNANNMGGVDLLTPAMVVSYSCALSYRWWPHGENGHRVCGELSHSQKALRALNSRPQSHGPEKPERSSNTLMVLQEALLASSVLTRPGIKPQYFLCTDCNVSMAPCTESWHWMLGQILSVVSLIFIRYLLI